jgi:hypothetical protein
VVAMVRADELELIFLIQYSLPWQAVASGSVSVVADVPVKTSILSDAPAVVAVVKDVYLVEKDPLTSSVELGVVVPIPTCAWLYVPIRITVAKNRIFIE